MKIIKKLFGFFWDKSLLFFAIIGGINTLITAVGSFFLTNYAQLSLFWATAIMFAVCSVPSFYFNRKYSFKSTAPLGQSIFRFSTIITTCFLLSYSLNHIIVPWMKAQFFPDIPDLWYSAIRILGIQVVFTLFNYMAQRLWAFTPKENTSPAENSAEENPSAGLS